MTAAPLSNSLAKVRALLPVKLKSAGTRGLLVIDRNGATFCIVPTGGNDTIARAELIRDAMNEMQ